ncbi:MAG TPA: hypothetical protein DD738_10480, partial [Ruminiclostridium sp.]|nr:hypothetical protein [Ruminiclostridium sp.]
GGDPELKNVMKSISALEGVSITLKNGEVVYPQFGAASWDSASADFRFKMIFIPPENVQSIAFLGQTFTFFD